jgi:hypothetical protein
VDLTDKKKGVAHGVRPAAILFWNPSGELNFEMFSPVKNYTQHAACYSR